MNNYVRIDGLRRVVDSVRRYSTYVQNVVDDELNAGAIEIANKARQRAPADEGILRNSIHTDLSTFLYKVVMVSAFYAPYQEFGTKSKTRVPAGFEQFAMQFKGHRPGSGGYAALLAAIKAWILRKGLVGRYNVRTRRRLRVNAAERQSADSLAYLIANSILKKGIEPHPFLIPSYLEMRPIIFQRIVSAIKALR